MAHPKRGVPYRMRAGVEEESQMSPTGPELGVVVASSGLHVKLIAFWVVVVLVVLAVVLLGRYVRARKRRLREVSDDWHPRAHTDTGKEQ